MSLSWDDLIDAFKKQFSDLDQSGKCWSGAGWCAIRNTPRYNDYVHYEIIKRGSDLYLEFHVETYANNRDELVKQLRDKLLPRHYNYFSHYSSNYWQTRTPICTMDDLALDVAKMRTFVDPIIGAKKADSQNGVNIPEPFTAEVGILTSFKLTDLLNWKLSIPEYQRAYCWRPSNIIDLLEGINDWLKQNSVGMYHLGTVILKKHKDSYDIIDGQQRLTTLAIWLAKNTNGNKDRIIPPLLNSPLQSNNNSKSTRNHLLRASQTIASYKRDMDLSRVELSVVILNEKQPEDLAYTFFNTTNSAGKRLSDYELLKTHHLRYIGNESMASAMVDRWHKMEREKQQDELLHQLLFRLRNWRSNSPFRLDAATTPERDLFRHYAVAIEPIPGLLTPPQATRFDSVLTGGAEFFNYAEYFRKMLVHFNEQPIVDQMAVAFHPHSKGVLHYGMKALAFLFFCKFGDVYLKEAVYCIAYRLSGLRNRTRIMDLYLAKEPVFAQSTTYLDRATLESQFFASMLDPRKAYCIINNGARAKSYWESLFSFLKGIEESSFGLPNQYKRSATLNTKNS
jgi:hypothetical protein